MLPMGLQICQWEEERIDVMNAIKRVLNIVFLLVVALYVFLTGLLLATAYDKKTECETTQALHALCINISQLACESSDEAKWLQTRYQSRYGISPPPIGLLHPLFCSEDQPAFWEANLYKNAVLYSVLLAIASLTLLIVNYVSFGSLTLWHKAHLRK